MGTSETQKWTGTLRYASVSRMGFIHGWSVSGHFYAWPDN